MATTTIAYTGQLTVVTCWCGIKHAIPANLHSKAKADPTFSVYCPLGHSWVFRVSDVDRIRAELDQAKADARFQYEQRERVQREADHQAAVARGYKGALVQAKKRATAGVCPAPGCKRSFANVARHVANCHPGLTE